MIPAGVQVYVASTPVDFRKGATGLMALVRDGGADPFSGALYVFRSKRAQHATFCIQSSKCDNCISMASADRAGNGAAELCAVACPCRRDGLEKGSTDNGAASAIGWLAKGCDILNRGI